MVPPLGVTRIVLEGAKMGTAAFDRRPVHVHREVVYAGVGDHRADLMFQSRKMVNIRWSTSGTKPIEVLMAIACVATLLVWAAGRHLADSLRRRYGIAAR